MARQRPCPVSLCQRNISIVSKFGVCAVHDDLFRGITYYLKQAERQAQLAVRKGIRQGERVRPSGIILP